MTDQAPEQSATDQATAEPPNPEAYSAVLPEKLKAVSRSFDSDTGEWSVIARSMDTGEEQKIPTAVWDAMNQRPDEPAEAPAELMSAAVGVVGDVATAATTMESGPPDEPAETPPAETPETVITPEVPETPEDPRDAKIRELENQLEDLKARLSDIETQQSEIMDALTDPAPPETPETAGTATDEPQLPKESQEPQEPEEPQKPEDEAETVELNTVESALTALNQARDELIKYKIRRSARIHDVITPGAIIGRSQGDLKAYNAAMENYRAASDRYLEARYDAHKAAGPGITDEDVKSLLLADEHKLHKEFQQREFEMEDQNWDAATSTEDKNFLRRLGAKKNRFIRWYADQKTWKKVMAGAGIGAGAALLASTTAGAGIALLAAGAASRFSLGLAGRNASARNATANSRKAEEKNLDKFLAKLSKDNNLDIARAAILDRLTGRVDNDVERRQRKNKIGTAVLLGGAALTGLGFAGIDAIPSSLPWQHGSGGNGGNNLPSDYNTEYVGSPGITGANLPAGMDLIQSSNGHLALYDNVSHREILNGGSLPRGLFDRQGNLSFAGRAYLRKEGFSLEQMTNLAGRFMTTINRSGS